MIPLTISNGVTVLAVTVILASDRSRPHAPGPREPAVHERAGHPVLPAPPPVGDGDPAGVGRAGRGGGGDRGRGPGGEGLRRRGACRRPASRWRPTTSTSSRWRRPASGPSTSRPSSCCPTSASSPRSATAATRCSTGSLTLGELVAFNVYVVMLIWPLRMLGMIIAQGQRAAASAERVREVLETAPGHRRRPPGRLAPARRSRRRARRGALRRRAVRLRARAARACSTASTWSCRPASRWRSWAPPARARPPWPGMIPRFYDVGRRLGVARRRRRAHAPPPGAAQGGRHRVRGDVPVLRQHRRQHRVRRPARLARPTWSAPPAWPGAHEFIERAARGLRHPHRRAGLLAVGRAAAAHRHRPGHPRRPAGADPRRRHVLGRPHQGARDPRRPRRGDARPHHDRDRPPARPPSPWPTAWCCCPVAGWWPTAPTTELLADCEEYREVLAAAERREAEGELEPEDVGA